MFAVKDCTEFTDQFYKKVQSELNDFQKKKIAKLKSIDDQNLSLLALHLLSELSQVAIDRIEYLEGRPLLDDLYCSITHKYPFVGVCVSDCEVGIDIETIRKVDPIAIRYLDARDSFDALVKWTRKESEFKSGTSKEKSTRTIVIERELILSISESLS